MKALNTTLLAEPMKHLSISHETETTTVRAHTFYLLVKSQGEPVLRTECSQPGTQPWPARSCPTRAGSHWLFQGMRAYDLLIASKFSVIKEIQAASTQILPIAKKSMMDK